MFAPGLWRARRLTEAVPELMRLQRDMNRLFFHALPRSEQDFPAINIWEDQDSVYVTTEIPGIEPDKFDVSVTGDILTLGGSMEQNGLKEGETYLRQERAAGSFKRSIKLPFAVESKNVEAKYEKGVLYITLPRLKEEQPKKIKINS
jgi:HSP20 family protein